MHELALSQSIVDLVLERAGAARLRTVTRVAVAGGAAAGVAVMAARADLEFDTVLLSDSAPVVGLVSDLLDAVPGTHVLRDPTRGGLATVLCEIAVASRVGIRLEEAAVPVRPEVQGGCELLGFDPLYVACEGRFVAILPEAGAERALAALHACPGGAEARRIGRVVAEDPGRVHDRLVFRRRGGDGRYRRVAQRPPDDAKVLRRNRSALGNNECPRPSS